MRVSASHRWYKIFFRVRNRWGHIYRGKRKHFNYLANYPLPVILVICDPDTAHCYWEEFRPIDTRRTDTGWKIVIPETHDLARSKAAIEDLLPPPSDAHSMMEEEWEFAEFVTSVGAILLTVDRGSVETLDFSDLHRAIDRLSSTKELSRHCFEKVEISFNGYDDDPRELYEIEAVRSFVKMMVNEIDVLLFYLDSKHRGATLRLIALCISEYDVLRVNPETGRRNVSYETAPVAEWLEGAFAGFNRMTEFVGISIEENKRVTKQIFQTLMPFDRDAPFW